MASPHFLSHKNKSGGGGGESNPQGPLQSHSTTVLQAGMVLPLQIRSSFGAEMELPFVPPFICSFAYPLIHSFIQLLWRHKENIYSAFLTTAQRSLPLRCGKRKERWSRSRWGMLGASTLGTDQASETQGLIPGLARSPGGGHGNPLQYTCLDNPIDRGAWRATVHRFTKSRT